MPAGRVTRRAAGRRTGRGVGAVRGLARAVAVAACLAGAAALLTGSPAAGRAPLKPLRMLQLNLCDSGIAACYTGRSVPEAAAVIRGEAPDLVTLNEVCLADVAVLDRAMRGVHPTGTVAHEFRAAADRRTGGPFRCRNGQPYGIALLAYLPGPAGYTADSGIYPTQDVRDPEERAWLCVDAAAGFAACTTHLASTSATVALAQCEYLLGTVVPAQHVPARYRSAVLGGDLNLRYGGSPDVRSCVPPGYLRRDDGGVQQVMATTDFAVGYSATISMNGTTDHPGLLVALTAAS